MKTLLVGAVVAGGAAFALRRLAPRLRTLHSHCREVMHDHCGAHPCCASATSE
jgi:hypothetical protein